MFQLTDEARAFLSEPRFAVVATINKDGSPQQTVVWYELRGDRVMMNTLAGRLKERNLGRDPRLSFSVEDGYRYITLTGRAELVYEDETAKADMRALSIRYQGEEEGAQRFENVFSKQARVSIYMTIENGQLYGFE